PTLYDYDNDGLLDMVIANKKKTITPSTFSCGLTLYRNTGTSTTPSFEFVTDDFLNLIAQNYQGKLSPDFADMDADGDSDLLLGYESGQMIYYRNDAGTFVFVSAFYMSIDVGNSSSVQIFDINKDGKLDLLLGEKNGTLNYFQNLGSTTVPFFATTPTVSQFGGFSLNVPPTTDSYSTTHIFRQSNDTKLLVTAMNGDIYLYGNIDGNLAGNFTLLDTVASKYLGNRYGPLTSIAGGDLNGDSKEDFVLGFYGGGVQVYYQDIVNTTTEIDNKSEIRVFPNPANDQFVVRMNTKLKNVKCAIYDSQSRLISEQMLIDGYSVFNTSKLSAGIYYLHLRTSENDEVKKIIITHSK
ncbi:MAG: T9SS type A sorting domain-containing protein, partial [Bacteroidia bacterium]|nr:T9SS type A sorting domain-containing protein [Bacteroidia bacterium]